MNTEEFGLNIKVDFKIDWQKFCKYLISVCGITEDKLNEYLENYIKDNVTITF